VGALAVGCKAGAGALALRALRRTIFDARLAAGYAAFPTRSGMGKRIPQYF